MITYVPFHIDHLNEIIPTTPEKETWRLMKGHIVALDNGHAYTCMEDGQPIACGGVILLWEGVAEGWLALSPAAAAHGMILTRYVIRALSYKVRELKLRRVQAHVDSTFDAAWYWLERMGFQRESVMPKYGPHGQTYYMYVWFPT